MLKNRLFVLLGLLVIASMVLAACGGAVATEAPVVEETEAPAEPQATEAPATEEPAAPATTRKGGWLDEITVTVVGADSVITQLQAGAIDMYSSGLASSDLPAILEAGLKSSVEIGGSYYELTYNPYGSGDNGATFAESTGALNPFAVAKIREAMNMLVDRDYLNQEVYAGGGLPKFFTIVTNQPDYANFAETARRLEAKYAYNPEEADAIISAEMEALGAERGGWQVELQWRARHHHHADPHRP
jgi:peptide/nickel transport system substrate-binding protein